MNAGRLAGLLGLMTGAGAVGMPEDAEAAASKDFHDLFVKLARDLLYGKGKRMNVLLGDLEPAAYERLRERHSNLVFPNKLYAPTHAAERHAYDPKVDPNGFGEFTLDEMATKFEALANSDNTRPLPNYETSQYSKKSRESAGLLSNGDPLFYAPYMIKDDGIYLTSGFKPDEARRRFITDRFKNRMPGLVPLGLLPGGPLSPFLDLRWDSPRAVQDTSPANAQRRGFSAVGSAPYPEQMLNAGSGEVNDNKKKSSGALRQLGIGTRNVMEGLGRGLSWGYADPGRVLADLFGLPAPVPGTPEAVVSDIARGGADAMGFLLPGAGMARMAGNQLAKSIGRAWMAKPGRQAGTGSAIELAAGEGRDAIGGLLGMISRAHEMQDEEEW